jgi:hypothetical protein
MRHSPVALLRAAAALILVFGVGLTAWLVDKAVQNPEVRAKRPRWFDTGVFDAAYWLPMILTVTVGVACMIYVFLKAARRLRAGEDLQANGFRERRREELRRAAREA